jgi:hypothetical protein
VQPRRFTRRTLIRTSALTSAGLAAAFVVGCGDDDDGNGATATPAGTTTAEPTAGPEQKTLVSGWYRDSAVQYYDFGMNSPVAGGTVATAPIWVMITGVDADGNPQFVEGQHNIVDVIPGDTGYSDLWEVNLVTVPEEYEPDSLKSREDVEASGYETMVPGLLVNCPIVPEGTTLEGGEELVQGWYKGEPVFYPDFGENPATTLPIWVFITGMDADGNPQFMEGQNNVIDAVPGDAGYSAFWQVNLVTVDEGYEANTIKSAADALASGFEITEADMVVNCPVTVF